MLPILLTAISLPLLYGLCIYSTYERVFVSLNITIKDPILRRKARRCLITKFRCDVVALEKWRRHSAIFEQSTMNDIDSSIRSEEHTSELQSLMRISYAVFCLKKKKQHDIIN